jgi:hypothetical protein
MTDRTLMQQPEPTSTLEGRAGTSPFLIEFFMVQSLNFYGMAYRDDEGKWHSALNHEELGGEVCLLE